MTEDERNNDLDYLRGRIDALEEVISIIVDMLPSRALRSVEHQLSITTKHIEKNRDDHPTHIEWDKWERSHFPKEKPPAVTLHASGFLDAAEPIMHAIPDMQYNHEEGTTFPLLAPSHQANQADEEDRDRETIPE